MSMGLLGGFRLGVAWLSTWLVADLSWLVGLVSRWLGCGLGETETDTTRLDHMSLNEPVTNQKTSCEEAMRAHCDSAQRQTGPDAGLRFPLFRANQPTKAGIKQIHGCRSEGNTLKKKTPILPPPPKKKKKRHLGENPYSWPPNDHGSRFRFSG